MIATSSTTLWYATRATGLVALVLLTCATVLGILTAARLKNRHWPAFAQAELHRKVSVLAAVFLGVHILTSITDSYVHLGWASMVVPWTSHYDRFWTTLGTLATDLIIAVAVSSAMRNHIGARTWRLIHWTAYGSWPLAMAHALGMGSDARFGWVAVLAVACALSVIAAVAWRIVEHARAIELARQARSRTRVISTRLDRPPVPR